MRSAWCLRKNPAALNKDKIADYTRRWAERDFGPEYAAEIADIAATYAKYNGWRKPEQITPETFSQLHYGEADRVDAAWESLVARAEKVYAALPANERDAFYQLVLHPTKASATVAEMNIAAGRNQLYAKQGRASTNIEGARGLGGSPRARIKTTCLRVRQYIFRYTEKLGFRLLEARITALVTSDSGVAHPIQPPANPEPR